MFWRFLDATDYWFGYSDDSSAGSYDPAQECFVVLANDPVGTANAAEAGDGEVPSGPGAGPIAPPPSPPRGADINAQLAQARELEAKLAEEYRIVRLLHATITGEASAGQASPRPHQRRLRRRQPEHAPASEPEAHCRRDAVTGHACPLDARGAEPAPRGASAYRASGRPTGRKLGVPHPSAGERAGRRGCARPRAIGAHVRCSGASRQPGTHADQGAAPRHARASPRQ
jgi:hypothetical protein